MSTAGLRPGTWPQYGNKVEKAKMKNPQLTFYRKGKPTGGDRRFGQGEIGGKTDRKCRKHRGDLSEVQKKGLFSVSESDEVRFVIGRSRVHFTLGGIFRTKFPRNAIR